MGVRTPEDGTVSRWRRFCTPQQSILVSVDDADEVMAHVLFRQRYGPDAPLPAALLPANAEAVKWVLLDVFDMFVSWHAQNRAACDVCGLFLQPFQKETQTYVLHTNHARSA